MLSTYKIVLTPLDLRACPRGKWRRAVCGQRSRGRKKKERKQKHSEGGGLLGLEELARAVDDAGGIVGEGANENVGAACEGVTQFYCFVHPYFRVASSCAAIIL